MDYNIKLNNIVMFIRVLLLVTELSFIYLD